MTECSNAEFNVMLIEFYRRNMESIKTLLDYGMVEESTTIGESIGVLQMEINKINDGR